MNWVSIGSDNGLSPFRRQTIIWTNAGLLFIRPKGTNFSEIVIKVQIFSFTKMHLKIWYMKCQNLKILKNRIIWSSKRIPYTEQHIQRSNCVQFQDSNLTTNHFRNAKNVTIEFRLIMRIFCELRHTIIELVRTLYLKGVLAKFKNIWDIS